MMTKKLLLLTLIVLTTRSVFWLGFNVPAAAPIAETQLSCIQPEGKAVQACKELEQHILATTVRIELHGWSVAENEAGYNIDSKIGHATIREGRYLVTHNHFTLPLSIRPREGDPETYVTVKLSNSSGETFFEGPLSDFDLVWEDAEALVIAYKDDTLFENPDLVSAEFSDWSSVPLEAGMEVAQVDWDGVTTRVDWTTIKEVNVQDGVPRLVLADDVTLGASGGGIFWHGVHIANNWLSVQELGASDNLINSTTKVALNSAGVAGEPS